MKKILVFLRYLRMFWYWEKPKYDFTVEVPNGKKCRKGDRVVCTDTTIGIVTSIRDIGFGDLELTCRTAQYHDFLSDMLKTCTGVGWLIRKLQGR